MMGVFIHSGLMFAKMIKEHADNVGKGFPIFAPDFHLEIG